MAFMITMMVVAIIIISTLKLCYQLFHFEAAISAARNVEEERGVVCHLVIGIFAGNFVSLWLFAFFNRIYVCIFAKS